MQLVFGAGIFLLYWFVAKPGFEKVISSDNPTAGVVGLSVCYFIVAGLLQAYGFHPLFIYLFVKLLDEGTYSSGISDKKDMLFLGNMVYWGLIIAMYFFIVKPYLKNKFEAKAKAKTEDKKSIDISKLQ